LTLKTAFISLVFLLLPAFAGAQEGHPIKGTWRGEISMGSNSRALVMILGYDGDTITGMINPGRSSYRFSSSELDAPNWTLNASATNRDGVNISFSATLHEIGARNRYLEGTWTEAGRSYPFRVTRE
jgi:hypothetical protein